MNINELFEKIQLESTIRVLNGEFILSENEIIWSYVLENNEGLDYFTDDDEESFSFERISSEEQLLEAYRDDYDEIQGFFDTIEQTNHWIFSEDEIIDNTISFKIY